MTATLLTVDQFREHVETALEDAAIQRLLDSAEDDINQHCGRLILDGQNEPSEVEEWFTRSRHMDVIWLKQPALSITEVHEVTTGSGFADTETELTIDEEFWFDDDRAIRRKDGVSFGDRVRVRYVPKSTVNRRRAAIIQLVKLEINVDPGISFEGSGSWQSTSQDYETQRQHLLWALCPAPVLA